ncbi:hypothetical protein BDZ91DRAFT_752932, partial [Kalaharituber pfeilii]
MEIAVHSEKETSEVNSSMLNSMAAHEYHSSAVASSRKVWQHSRSTAARIHPHGSIYAARQQALTSRAWQHSRSMTA